MTSLHLSTAQAQYSTAPNRTAQVRECIPMVSHGSQLTQRFKINEVKAYSIFSGFNYGQQVGVAPDFQLSRIVAMWRLGSCDSLHRIGGLRAHYEYLSVALFIVIRYHCSK